MHLSYLGYYEKATAENLDIKKDGRTERQTDGQTDGQSEGYINFLHFFVIFKQFVYFIDIFFILYIEVLFLTSLFYQFPVNMRSFEI